MLNVKRERILGDEHTEPSIKRKKKKKSTRHRENINGPTLCWMNAGEKKQHIGKKLCAAKWKKKKRYSALTVAVAAAVMEVMAAAAEWQP